MGLEHSSRTPQRFHHKALLLSPLTCSLLIFLMLYYVDAENYKWTDMLYCPYAVTSGSVKHICSEGLAEFTMHAHYAQCCFTWFALT